MSKINLTYGNPNFLFPYWNKQDLPDASLYYPSPYMGEEHSKSLETTIRSCHKIIGNVENIDEYNIVIGNGATQLLSAIIYETFGSSVSAPAPYFCRFPVITQLGANQWVSPLGFGEKIILSAPNNPTGDWSGYIKNKEDNRIKIVDACYNWPQYTQVQKLNDEIIVYSLSKATGHAGTRLGWALFKDKNLASLVSRSVEMSSMGISDLSQDIGRFVLNREAIRLVSGKENVFSAGREELDRRWSVLRNLELPFKILNDSGMFLWLEGEVPSHIEGLPGSMFGDTNKKFRLNIGCSLNDFNSFIQPYLKEEENGKEPTEV